MLETVGRPTAKIYQFPKRPQPRPVPGQHVLTDGTDAPHIDWDSWYHDTAIESDRQVGKQ